MYNILVVGAGYLGGAIARHFKEQKQRVYALTRESAKAAAFEDEGIQGIAADLNQPDSLKKIPAAHFVVISTAPDQSTEEEYRRIYLDGLRNFLESRKSQPRPYLMVLISSTSVWKDREGWVDETVPADADAEKGKILLASEKLILESGFPAVIFRLSGIYGPGRNRLEAFEAGKWPQPQEPDGFMNMIHVDDIARAMPVLFQKSKEGEIYLGTDGEPALRSEFSRWLAKKIGKAGGGQIDTTKVTGKRLRNTRLKEMGFQFQYPTFREGYSKLIEQRSS